jgi:uncharacterized protein YjbJ (UPF0337 family)
MGGKEEALRQKAESGVKGAVGKVESEVGKAVEKVKDAVGK